LIQIKFLARGIAAGRCFSSAASHSFTTRHNFAGAPNRPLAGAMTDCLQNKGGTVMLYRSGTARVAFASVAAGAAFAFCAGVVLMTAACGVRVSASDFPVLKLSSAADAEVVKK